MNKNKVEKYINDKMMELKKLYPAAIYKELKINVYSGSFGWITITIDGLYHHSNVYVSNYRKIDDVIYGWIHGSLYSLYQSYYYKHHKK